MTHPFAFYLALLSLAACQPPHPAAVTLNVSVSGLTSEVQSLDVRAVLNGEPASEPARSVTQHLDSFALVLPDDALGYLTLRFAGLGQVGHDGCQVATAEARVLVTGPGDYDVPVNLLPAPAGCQLIIQTLGDSAGSVIVPQGAQCSGDCALGPDNRNRCTGTCRISGPPQAAYLLTRSDETVAFFSGWFGDCVRQADGASCLATLGTGVETVRAYFQAKDKCTADGWCSEPHLPPDLGRLSSIWGNSASNLWAVGDQGTIVSSDGITWTRRDSGFRGTLRGVWSTDPGDAWAVGDAGAILHWDGLAWSPVASGTDRNLRAVWGSGPPPVWTVGDGGVILRWDGLRWSAAPSNTTSTLRSIWGSDNTNVWAVGDMGTILSLQPDGSWQPSPNPAHEDEHLYGVSGTRPSNVWAVGAKGATVRWQGQGAGWNYYPTGVNAALSGVWCDPEAGTFAVGDGGLLIRLDGISWDAQQLPFMTADLYAIWGAGPSDIWAVGDRGTIIRFRR